MALTSGTLKPVAEYPLRAGVGFFTYKTGDPALSTATGSVQGDGYFTDDNRITEEGSFVAVTSTNATAASAGYALLWAQRRPLRNGNIANVRPGQVDTVPVVDRQAPIDVTG